MLLSYSFSFEFDIISGTSKKKAENITNLITPHIVMVLGVAIELAGFFIDAWRPLIIVGMFIIVFANTIADFLNRLK